MGKIPNRENTGFWPSLAPSDLISESVTLGQDTYCMLQVQGTRYMVLRTCQLHGFRVPSTCHHVQKAQVDILAKVLYFKEFLQKSSFGK